eukprot:Opistho-1_new@60865
MAAHARRRTEGIVVDAGVIEREGLPELPVLVRLGVGIGGVNAPGRLLGVALDELHEGGVGVGLQAVVADDDRPERCRREAEGRVGRAGRREEQPAGTTIAQHVDEAVTAFDMRIADFQVEQAEIAAHAQAILVGIRHFQVVLDEAQLAPRTRRQTRDQRRASGRRLIIGAVGDAGHARRADVHRIARDDEVERAVRRLALRQFLLDEVELRAVVRTAKPAEDRETAGFVELVVEADARLPGTGERLTLLARRDIVADLVVGAVEVRIVGRAHRRDLRRWMDIVQERRGALIVPTQAEVDGQPIGDVPVVLHIDAELEVLRADLGVGETTRQRLEGHLVRRRRVERGRAERREVAEHGVEAVERQRVERHPLRLHADLDGMPLKPGVGEVVRDLPALLALVLEVGAAAGFQDVAVQEGAGPGRIRNADAIDIAVRFGERTRVPLHVLIRDLEVVDPAVSGMFPAGQAADFLHAGDGAGLIGGDAAAEGFTRFVAILAREFEQVAITGREVDLAEIQVLVELLDVRAVVPREARGEQRTAGAQEAGEGDVARVENALAFIGHEEVQDVLDDRATERTAEVEVLAPHLLAGCIRRHEFDRTLVAQMLVGEVDKTRPLELVGARLGHRGDRDRADLVELGLVVRADDAIFADRRLRERVALARILAGDAVLQDIVLLADAIDEDVDRVGGLRAALQAILLRAAAGEELHARGQIGKGHEVAVILRQLLDQALRDRGADFAALHRTDAAAGDDDLVAAAGGADAGRRQIEIELGILRDRDRELVGAAHAVGGRRLKPVVAGGERRELIAAIGGRLAGAGKAGVDVDDRDLADAAFGRHRAAQRRSDLGISGGSGADRQRCGAAGPGERDRRRADPRTSDQAGLGDIC